MADGAARPRHPMAPEDNLCVRGGRFSATTTTTDAFPALSEAEARAARPASSFKPERSAATGLPFRADTTTASSFVDYGDLARTARPGPARLGATLAVEPAPFAATTTTRDAFRRYDSAELGPPTSYVPRSRVTHMISCVLA